MSDKTIRVTTGLVQRARVADYWVDTDGTLRRETSDAVTDPIADRPIMAVRVMFPDHMTGIDARDLLLRVAREHPGNQHRPDVYETAIERLRQDWFSNPPRTTEEGEPLVVALNELRDRKPLDDLSRIAMAAMNPLDDGITF